MATQKRNRRKQKAARKTIEVGVPSNTYKAKEIIAPALYKLLKDFINEYNYGSCIMVGFEESDVYVYFKHWQQINWSNAPKVYLGKIKHKLIKPTYLWLA